MMCSCHVFLFSLLFVTFNAAWSDDILGCGGFIKSHIPIEFSKVEVGLYTKQGSLKDMTDCAPNNGYYFLPLYDQGDYILKVSAPTGWNFEPTEVSLAVDGETDACSTGKDINFVFVGFAVSGKVVSEGSTEGPAGVTIALLSEGGKESLLNVVTDAGGVFAFPRVAPGRYELRASHPKWILSQDRAKLVVAADSYQVIGTLAVAGYPVMGTVTSEKEPISGVSFVLHAEGGRKVGKPQGCLASSHGLCRAESGSDGHFVFPALTPGQYRIVPHYAAGKEGSAFDVRPREMRFTVEHAALKLAPEFQVKGFTVTGRVLSAVGGAGVADAKVLLNREQRALTGHDGSFRLENMQAGTYVLSAQADMMEFAGIEVRVTPGSPSLPDLVASSLAVCGKVALGQLPAGVSTGPRTVTATRLPERSIKVSSTTVEDTGTFCLMLAPGEYQLYVHASDAEIRRGLKFSPPTRQLTVKDKPLQGIDFSPLRATLTGQVVCLPTPCETLSITLSALDSELPPATQSVAADGSYTFTDVLPGQYEVRVKSDQTTLCWEKEARRFTIASSQSRAPDIVQTGYVMSLQASHPARVDYFNLDNDKVGSVEMLRGANTFCVPGRGPYMLIPESCHEFTSPWYSWEVGKGVLNLLALKHMVGGVVLSPDHYGDIIITVTREDGSTVNLGPLTARQSGQGGLEYRFEMMARPGEQLTLTPRADKLLFSPSSALITTGIDCQLDAATFRGDRGHFVEGKVSPPLEGVDIQISRGNELVTNTSTDKQGHYRAGPLPTPAPGQTYQVVATMDGYQMTETKEGFMARKLAEVVVRVKDAETGAPLAGVLLSLSGGEYRRNSQAGSDGTLTFRSLGPGDYFLRPKLKEYRFEPQSKMITVDEGATVEVDVSGRRVAFSCIGSVVSLSGEPEGGVALEAVGIGDPCKDQQEEAVSEPSGHFRVRGLLPNCAYEIRLKAGVEANKHIARLSPSNLKVQADNGDVEGVRVVAMRPPQQCDVSVLVVTKPPGPLLRLRLFREDQPDSPILEKRLEPVTMPQHYLVLPPLVNDGKAYYVQVDTAPSPQQHGEIETKIVYFTANSSFRHIRFEMGGLTKATGARQGSSDEDDGMARGGSLLLLPLLGVLGLAMLYRAKLVPLSAQLSAAARRFMITTPTPVTIQPPAPLVLDEELIVEPVSKRKPKLRKT